MDFKPCPLCNGPANGYTWGKAGLIRCWPCNLRLECEDGLEAAAEKWNKRAGELSDRDRDKVLEILDAIPATTVTLAPTTLEGFIQSQIGGPFYVSDKALKNGIGKRIKKSDHDRYKKLFESTRRT